MRTEIRYHAFSEVNGFSPPIPIREGREETLFPHRKYPQVMIPENRGALPCRVVEKHEVIIGHPQGTKLLFSRAEQRLVESISREIEVVYTFNREIGIVFKLDADGGIKEKFVSPYARPDFRHQLPIGIKYPHLLHNSFLVILSDEDGTFLVPIESGTHSLGLKPRPDFVFPRGIGLSEMVSLKQFALILKEIFLACRPYDWAGSWRPRGHISSTVIRGKNGRPTRKAEVKSVSSGFPRELRLNVVIEGNEVFLNHLRELARISAIDNEEHKRDRVKRFRRVVSSLLAGYLPFAYELGHEALGVKSALEVIREGVYKYVSEDPRYFGLVVANNEPLLRLLVEQKYLSKEQYERYQLGQCVLDPLPDLSREEREIAKIINIRMLRPVNGIQPFDLLYFFEPGQWHLVGEGGFPRPPLWGGMKIPGQVEEAALF